MDRHCDAQRSRGGSSFASMHTAQMVIHITTSKYTFKVISMIAHKRGIDSIPFKAIPTLLKLFYFCKSSEP